MAINKNHEFEELDGIKCGIVEKNVAPERVEFLKNILEFNKFTVVAVPSPPPKNAAVAKPTEGEESSLVPEVSNSTPKTYTLGVTDYTFNTINAIFGRLLKTPTGHIVTLDYWEQKAEVSDDSVPYFGSKSG